MSRMGEYDFSRLSDSRILYLRNPPRFSYIFVVAVVIVIAATLIWSSTAVRAEEIRASGMVVSGDSAEIVPQASGIVSAVNFSEGDRVKAVCLCCAMRSQNRAFKSTPSSRQWRTSNTRRTKSTTPWSATRLPIACFARATLPFVMDLPG